MGGASPRPLGAGVPGYLGGEGGPLGTGAPAHGQPGNSDPLELPVEPQNWPMPGAAVGPALLRVEDVVEPAQAGALVMAK